MLVDVEKEGCDLPTLERATSTLTDRTGLVSLHGEEGDGAGDGEVADTGDKGPNTHWAHCEYIESTGNM